MNDPIVDEVRQIRDAHAARLNYDLDAIYRDIKEQEMNSGHTFVAGAARPTAPSQTTQPTWTAMSVSQPSSAAGD